MEEVLESDLDIPEECCLLGLGEEVLPKDLLLGLLSKEDDLDLIGGPLFWYGDLDLGLWKVLLPLFGGVYL